MQNIRQKRNCGTNIERMKLLLNTTPTSRHSVDTWQLNILFVLTIDTISKQLEFKYDTLNRKTKLRNYEKVILILIFVDTIVLHSDEMK